MCKQSDKYILEIRDMIIRGESCFEIIKAIEIYGNTRIKEGMENKMKKAELEHWIKVYRQLNKTPNEPPCDVCKERIYPKGRVQGRERCGCGPVNLYVRLKAYDKLKGSNQKEKST